MAEAVTVARPYAEAVFKLAREQGGLDRWSAMLAFASAVAADPRMRAVIGAPQQGTGVVERLFLAVSGERLDGQARNLVSVLVENGRAELLPQIHEIFEVLKADAQGVLEARIQTAFALDDAQLASIVTSLERKYQRRIKAGVEVVPELIGGVKIEVGDQVLDVSMRGRLEAMSAALVQ